MTDTIRTVLFVGLGLAVYFLGRIAYLLERMDAGRGSLNADLDSRLDSIHDRLSAIESDTTTVRVIARKHERVYLQTYDESVAPGLSINDGTEKDKS